MTYKLGRLPNDPAKPRLRLALKDGAPPPPAAIDWHSGVASWGMLGNDAYGDCVFAANGHIVEQQTALGGGLETVVTTDETLAEYSRVTGFSPADPATDQGAMVQDGLNDLRKAGLAGRTIAAFAEVSPHDLVTVQSAVADLGAVSIGINLPASAMSQFHAGQPWDAVANDGGILGGHCVLLVGYDAAHLYVVTWGKVQPMTHAFWNAYVEECWPIVDRDWVSALSGLDPARVDLATLGEEFAALTGAPNPFPAPAPAPPAPQPEPVPPSPPAPVPPPIPLPPAPPALPPALPVHLRHAWDVWYGQFLSWLDARYGHQ